VQKTLRNDLPLETGADSGPTRTDAAGHYEIRYITGQAAPADAPAVDLIVRAFDANGKIVAESPVLFNAPEEASVDLAVSGAVAGQPSEYERVVDAVTPLLTGLNPPELTGLEASDLDFLVGATKIDRVRLTALLISVALHRDAVATGSAVPVEAFYGLLRKGLHGDWVSLLLSPTTTLTGLLVAAVEDGTVPVALHDDAELIAGQVGIAAARQALNPSGSSQPSEFSRLLEVAGLNSAKQQSVLTLAANVGGGSEQFWQQLRAEPDFQADGTVDRLQFTLQLGQLTGNHIPLIGQLLARNQLSSTRDLLSLDETSWQELLNTPVGGVPAGVPAGVRGATATEQAAAYVQDIIGTLRAAYPTETIARMVSTVPALVPDEQARLGVNQFFVNSPDFDIRSTRVSSYVATHGANAFAGIPVEAQPQVVSELKRVQRAFQISVSPETMSALLSEGLDAAHLVADIPHGSFIDRYAQSLGGQDSAIAVHARATFINSRSLTLLTQINDTVNGVWPRGLSGGSWGNGSAQTQAQLINQYPDYADLFGPLNPCACEDCRSVLSPAAYLVDVFEFLRHSAQNAFGNTPLDVLIGKRSDDGWSVRGRRPDLAYLKLTCENTNTELPYIDLVNEVLESYVAQWTTLSAAHDTGQATTAELDASPQYTLAFAYAILWEAVFPFSLPFCQPIEVARTYLRHLGTSRAEVLETFQITPEAAAAAVDAEGIRLDPFLYQLLTGKDLAGGSQPVPSVGTLYGYPGDPGGWEDNVAKVPTFLSRTGVTATELTQLLRTRFINPNYPRGADRALFENIPISYTALTTLAAQNFTTSDPTVLSALQAAKISLTELAAWWSRNPNLATVLVIYSPNDSCDFVDASIAHLGDHSAPTDTELAGMQAFIRLWRTLQWAIAELDRAITALSTAGIDPALIHNLARVGQLQRALGSASLQSLFVVWSALDPEGDDSLYAQTFLNPALPAIDPAFQPAADGTVLAGTEVISAHIPALLAALQISATDFAQSCADAGLDANYTTIGQPAGTKWPLEAQLSLANVSTLYRYALLAHLLGLSLGDMIALKGLSGIAPFDAPDSTLWFVALAQAVTSSAFKISELLYLYRHDSTPPRGLAPTKSTLVVLAQALRAGLTQIASATATVPDPKGTLTHSTLVQLVSKTVADQTVNAVNGTAVYAAGLADLPAVLALRNGAHQVTGIDPTRVPADVGQKLGYDPINRILTYRGVMTSQERSELLGISAETAYLIAVNSLYQQPGTFLTDSLALLLNDPAAETTLWRAMPSLDGSLNPVYLDAKGQIANDPSTAVSSAIAAKYAYLVGKLVPALRKTLSHSLIKQTIADTFSIDPAISSLLVETVLVSPTVPGKPVVTDLLDLANPGVTATYYATGDLSGPPTFTGTVASVSLDGIALASSLPGVRSARFVSWLSVPTGATFTFRIQTNGTPELWVGDGTAPPRLTPDPNAPGTFKTTVALTAGQLVLLRLEITALPTSPVVALSWQTPTIAHSGVPADVQLPAGSFDAFSLAYIRIQKAALLCKRFSLTTREIGHLQRYRIRPVGMPNFDLNALPLTPRISPTEVAVLFAFWPQINAYAVLRASLSVSPITLIDVFTASTFGDVIALLPQATGWDPQQVSALLAGVFPTTQPSDPNPLADELMPNSLPNALKSCVQLIDRIGASADQLLSWTVSTWPNQGSGFASLHTVADDIKKVVASHYDSATWPAVAETLSDSVRTAQRDALVAHLVCQLALRDPNGLFEFLLIDPEMGTCMQTSRIRQAINSAQLFVQRCLLNLEQHGDLDPTTVAPSQIDRTTWDKWKGQYSLWAANREVFLFPENWLLPQVRDDQTPLFKTFASALLQGDVTTDRAQTALLDYLKGLDQVARLDIRAMYHETGAADVMHVFARTFHTPYKYFYRQLLINEGTWTPWEPVQVDIQGDHLIPVVWEGRLRLIWPVFTQQTITPPATDTVVTTSGGTSTSTAPKPAKHYWKIVVSWSEYYQGKWQPKQVSADFLLSMVWSAPILPFWPYLWQADAWPMTQSSHEFTTVIDRDDLVVSTYVDFNDVGFAFSALQLLGEFRFSACGDTITVAYAPGKNLYGYLGAPPWPPGIDKSPNQQDKDLPSPLIVGEPSTIPYFNGLRQTGNGGPPTGGPPLQLKEYLASPITYLADTPTRFDLRHPEPSLRLGHDASFFYQDALHTFYVNGGIRPLPRSQLTKPASVDLLATLAATTMAATARASVGPVLSLASAPPPARPTTSSPVLSGARTSSAIATSPALTPPAMVSAGRTNSNWVAPASLTPAASDFSAGLWFQTHRHPYVCDFIKAVVNQGVSGLLDISNQNPASTFDFSASYLPTSSVLTPFPAETVDFQPTGAYSGYTWELFFHAPLLVALTLSQNQRYEDANTWFRYIFDPTVDPANNFPPVAAPGCYWQVQPFRTATPDSLLQLMEDIDNNVPDAVKQVSDWEKHPFQPYRIARMRLAAFQKNVFMRYLDNLIAWGDQLFGQVDTIESINQATQLYILAANLLGPLPDQVLTPTTQPELCYAQLGILDPFGNILEILENQFPYASGVPAGTQAETGGLLGMSKTLLFCIPQNPTLLQYWNTVADRLYKIRHCLNIRGVPQQLALFQAANPLWAIGAGAEGTDPGSIPSDLSAPLPNYRFSYLIGKASELVSECQAFGRALLEALEKNSAEELALLRATQETNVLTLMRDLKQHQVDEANATVDAFHQSRAVAVARYTYYQLLLGTDSPIVPAIGEAIAPVAIPSQPSQSTGGAQLIRQEQRELDLSEEAAFMHIGAAALQAIAGGAHLVPTVQVNVLVQPMGVGASTGVSSGGPFWARAAEAVAKGAEVLATYMTYQAFASGKMAGYFRRQQEWANQSNQASGEIMRIDQEIAAAQLRVTIANDNLAVHDQQSADAQKIQDLLTFKFTNQQLYSWMVDQASSLYSQLYQLSYDTAKLAEVAYRRELAVEDSTYITFGYWDSLRKGLLAGDRLKLAVKQLERAHLDRNQREYEIARHVSLLLHDPAALIALKTMGQCVVDLPEELFDLDYPGHYLRRLRDVSLTIPCVVGPYTSINCTLTLLSSRVRHVLNDSLPYRENSTQDPRFIYNFAATQSIATSHAQNDSGLFEVSFRDERYLPFETAGAISRWMITMPPACNAFDFDTITDVVLKLSYTSRYGGDLLRSQAFSAATLPPLPQQMQPALPDAAPQQTDRRRLFSARHEFPTEWYRLLQPPTPPATYGQMPITLTVDRFPSQYRTRTITTSDIEIVILPNPGKTPSIKQLYLTPQSLISPAPPPPSPDTIADRVNLSPSNPGSSYLHGQLSPSTSTTVPQIWWLSIDKTDLATVTDEVQDIFVLFHHAVS
jgi:hypothetical protein